MVLAKGVDHCRAGFDTHRSLVDDLALRKILPNGREYPTSRAPARMFISGTVRQWSATGVTSWCFK